MAFSVGQVVKVTREGTTLLGVVTTVRADGDVDVDVMVPVNVQRITIPLDPSAPSDPLIEA